MAAGRRYLFNSRSFILATLCCLLALVLAIWSYGQLKAASYARLMPVSIELQVLVGAEQNLILQYDYGYGFNESHQQLQRLQPSEQPYIIGFSISSWKKPAALRVVVADADQISLRSANLQRGDEAVRLIAPARPDNQPDSVVLWVDDVSALLQGGA